MNGRIKLAIINPPAIKQMVANSDGHCSVDKPMMECPLVQPPAYLVPKPTKKPPTTIMVNPLIDKRLCQLNNWFGTKPRKSVMPYPESSVASFVFICMGAGLAKKLMAIMPPKKIPATKNKFQISFFHW